MLSLKDASLLKSQCYVNGRGSATARRMSTIRRPATSSPACPRWARRCDLAAVEAAEAAFKPWAAKLAKERSAIMRKWFELIMANQRISPRS